ncbi:MAG: ABC transporter ATP-binding protein [Christensenellaceae bacterium]|jgi:ABC-2 type transport system ATP-binding protein
MVFSADGLKKSFGNKEVLKGISLQAESGKAFGLLGRNGAGKTTSIRIIMGVFPPDEGRVLIDGQPIQRDRLRIGYLPEERGLYAKTQIMEQLVYLARLKGMHTRDAKASILRLLERLDMGEYAYKKLDVLSKGNQQKIQLAAALLSDPELIILDEPFSGLDPVNASLLKDVIKEEIHKGKLVFFSSHQMNYVEEFCDSIAILNHGKIVLNGDIGQIKRSYDRRKMSVKSMQSVQVLDFVNAQLGNIVSSTNLQGNELFLELREEGQKNDLISALAQAHFDIDSIQVFEPSLNDIFVEYAGDDAEGGQQDEAV